MTAKDILLVILGAVFANNLVFEGFMGLPAVLGEKKDEKKSLFTGLWVGAVMLLSQAAFWPVGQFLTEQSMTYLIPIAAVAVILVIVLLGKLVLSGKMGDGFVLIALNSAVLGLCLTTAGQCADFGAAMLNAVGAALGFLAAMLLFSGVKSRIDEKYVPAPFRGLPILLLAAFIVAMALTAYK